jgi:hypothetical protein
MYIAVSTRYSILKQSIYKTAASYEKFIYVSNQPSIQRAGGTLSLVIKQLEHDIDEIPPFCVEVESTWSLASAHICIHDLLLKHWTAFPLPV